MYGIVISLVLVLLSVAVSAEPPRSGLEFQSEDVRSQQEDDFRNPGMLWVDEGAVLFDRAAGTTGKACADCHEDLRSVATLYPKRNAHTGELVTLAGQVEHCRVAHQGEEPAGYESAEILALTAWLGYGSRGQSFAPVDPSLAGDIAAGRAYYEARKGQFNLACSHCHERHVGDLLRGDTISEGHGNGYPAYRLEWQTLGSLHRRFRACDIGVRAEPPPLGGAIYTRLELYLRVRAGELPIETPAVRR